MSTVDNAVQTSMAWTTLSGRGITLDDTAELTWSGAGSGHTHQVEHQFVWTRADGSRVEANGLPLQALLVPSEGLVAGLVVSGARDWSHDGDLWHMSINNAEIAGFDPFPIQCSYTGLTSHNKEFRVELDLNDDDTLSVVVSGNIQSYPFTVTHEGEVVE